MLAASRSHRFLVKSVHFRARECTSVSENAPKCRADKGQNKGQKIRPSRLSQHISDCGRVIWRVSLLTKPICALGDWKHFSL